MRSFLVILFTLTLFIAYVPLCYSAAAITIESQTPYLEQRSCVKICLKGYLPDTGDLIYRLGCTYPYVNECYCRADAPPRASSILSDCVTSLCTDIKSPTVDVSNAISVYNGYCATAAGVPATNNAQPTSNGGADVTVVILSTVTATNGAQMITVAYVTITRQTPVTSKPVPKTITISSEITVAPLPTSGSLEDKPKEGLTRADKIALGVGIGIGLPATLAALVTCCITISRL